MGIDYKYTIGGEDLSASPEKVNKKSKGIKKEAIVKVARTPKNRTRPANKQPQDIYVIASRYTAE